jgi:hypothetical protein
MDTNFNIISFVCNVKSCNNKSHIVREPVQLECLNFACKLCILQSLNTKNNHVKCNCNLQYHLVDKDQLKVDDDVTKMLETNLNHFYDWIQSKEVEVLGKLAKND